MARSRRPDVIEIFVEPLDTVTARANGERPARPRPPAPVGGMTVGPVPSRVPNPAAHPLKGMSPSFRRLVEVSGAQLPLALDQWWRDADHDDRHLVLQVPRRLGTTWALSGALRRTTASRWIPVELVLTPYAERWALLELVPRRQVRVGRRWFRNGHDSIDRFVADLLARATTAVGVSGVGGPVP
jgi:hypothetical protein